MDFVYGTMEMYYASSTWSGYKFPVQGVYLASTGFHPLLIALSVLLHETLFL